MPDQFQRPYLDSSVYIAAIKGEAAEPGRGDVSAQVLELGRQGTFPIFASTFVYAEVIKDRDTPQLTEAEEAKIDAYLDQAFITWIELDLLIAKAARGLARKYRLKPADAIHLATAVRVRADQLLAWNPKDFKVGTTMEGVQIEEPHLIGYPALITGFLSES
jgi:predicted nucleic acid-binding protein